MRNSRSFLPAALVLACALSAGCNLVSDIKNAISSSPTSPSSSTPTVSMDVFSGTWSSASASTPATGCGDVTYTVSPVSSTTANVTFAATCGGSIAVNGAGSGTLSGSALVWNANGVVNQGGITCPFSFTNGQATQDSSGAGLVVTYAGTVCGIPASGTEAVKK
jgi:predicted small secreted protein